MENAQVRVQLIPHARGHYLAVAGYRYCVKTRKQGRDAELVYWKCTEMDCPGTVNTTDNLVTIFPRDHNHPPSHADIKAKLVLSHLSEKARSCLDPLPTLYDSEIIQFRCREWDEDTRQIVEKIPTFTACKSSLYRQRNTELPRQPATRQNIDLQAEWRETSTGQNFVLSEDGDINKILVFGLEDNELSALTCSKKSESKQQLNKLKASHRNSLKEIAVLKCENSKLDTVMKDNLMLRNSFDKLNLERLQHVRLIQTIERELAEHTSRTENFEKEIVRLKEENLNLTKLKH
ncbi:unnamed protein product [Mytilus coruscus]|uniref:Uncharacterized protein n=1 Tax=Mytilus coruscus TaxID=42192 RepID=A0A6J8D6U4_MYTCO|nr:unnamed protein product [Mytilus coruscus]